MTLAARGHSSRRSSSRVGLLRPGCWLGVVSLSFACCCSFVSFVPPLLFASGLVLSSPTYSFPDAPYRHTMALFGPDPDSAGYNVTAELVYLGPTNPYVCNALTKDEIAAVKGKIVLAQRDPACEFMTRALVLAQGSQPAGLIIGDNRDSNTFDSQWMGPWRDPPSVGFPVIFVAGVTWEMLLGENSRTRQAVWVDTKASIDKRGLIYDMADYYASIDGLQRAANWMKIITVGVPMLVVLYSYWIFLQLWREQRRPAAQRQQQQQAEQAAAPAAAAAEGAAVVVAVEPVPIAPADGGADQQQQQQQQHRRASAASSDDGSREFNDGELHAISLPIPPHLSSAGEDVVGRSASGSSESGPSSVSSTGGSSGSGGGPAGRSDRAIDESEGALLGSRGRSNLSDANDLDNLDLENDHALSPAPASAAAAANRAGGAGALGRPLLQGASIATSRKVYYHLLKALSQLGKPAWILRVNALVFLVHAVSALVVLVMGWNESCVNSNQSMVSLWGARALIGLRICFWQTHSSTPRPTCLDIFFKNWADCIFLFTGSLSSFSEAQKHDCEVKAPITFKAVEMWTILIFITYGGRLLLYLCDRLSQHYMSRLPHLFTIGSRSLLSLSQGGFSCAGALDSNQPATQLDLMLIPTATFQEGMYAADDAVCGVCLGDYANGEQLRVLRCSHHFHKECVDTWLQQKNTCPSCRSSIDSSASHRRPAAELHAEQQAAAAAAAAAQRRQQAHEQGQEMVSPRPMAAAPAAAASSASSSASLHRPPSPSRVDSSEEEHQHAYFAAAGGEQEV